MSYKPEHLKRWTLSRNYAGAHWPEYFSSGVGQSRDSDALERSNFHCMLRELGGETETVIVVRESHWAVGWVEWIAIHQDDAKALETADEIKGQLKDYPVISDDHFSQVEQDDANDIWRDCYSPQERIRYVREHRSQFEFRDWRDMMGCLRGNYFAGYTGDFLS